MNIKKRVKTYTISAVAELYDIHPQTLRLYEREGLLKPSRSVGNTRLYEDSDLERLEVILSLTRDLGVNLAGVEIILNMREKMDADAARVRTDFLNISKTHANEFSRHSEDLSSRGPHPDLTLPHTAQPGQCRCRRPDLNDRLAGNTSRL